MARHAQARFGASSRARRRAVLLALMLPALAGAAPVRYSVLVASTQPAFVLPQDAAGWSGHADLFIDATPVARLTPGAALPVHALGLDEGPHQFRFSIALHAPAPGQAGSAAESAEIEEDCLGQFEVSGSTVLQPHLEIRAQRPAPGKPGDSVACAITAP